MSTPQEFQRVSAELTQLRARIAGIADEWVRDATNGFRRKCGLDLRELLEES